MSLLLNLFSQSLAFAQEHAAEVSEHVNEAAEHEVVIPWGNIGVQAFNLFLLLGILGYFLHKSVKAYFAHRATEYREMVDRAENARRTAEASRNQIQERMNKLEASAKQGVEQARTEAEQLRARLVDEAKTLSKKLEQEAQRTASVELEKAKAELRHDLLTKALAMSGDNLRKGLGAPEQKKLQTEFVEKIEVVGR